MARRKTKNVYPLIMEPHPEDYNGYPFITLIQYSNDKEILAIVDNSTDKSISFFVLDLCGPERIDEEQVIEIASEWYNEGRNARYPISIEFSRLGVSDVMSRIYKSFNIDFVSRVIGPVPRFNMNEKGTVKRRKRKPIPRNMELHGI